MFSEQLALEFLLGKHCSCFCNILWGRCDPGDKGIGRSNRKERIVGLCDPVVKSGKEQ